jgi:hypothetical protein
MFIRRTNQRSYQVPKCQSKQALSYIPAACRPIDARPISAPNALQSAAQEEL